MQTPQLGKLEKIRIEHDNTGASPGWMLDKARCGIFVILSANHE